MHCMLCWQTSSPRQWKMLRTTVWANPPSAPPAPYLRLSSGQRDFSVYNLHGPQAATKWSFAVVLCTEVLAHSTGRSGAVRHLASSGG
eukprot:1615318-Amphidinium_carterae.1